MGVVESSDILGSDMGRLRCSGGETGPPALMVVTGGVCRSSGGGGGSQRSSVTIVSRRTRMPLLLLLPLSSGPDMSAMVSNPPESWNESLYTVSHLSLDDTPRGGQVLTTRIW